MTDLLVERYEAHALLTLNRPEKRNALSVALRDAISDTLDSLVRDDGM
jgi:enoyl-CoA hydratase/carnithine racemase